MTTPVPPGERLNGVAVVVTRPLPLGSAGLHGGPAGPADPLVRGLQAEGATPIHIPLVSVSISADTGHLERALENLRSYGWIVFTSANAVRAISSLRPGGLPAECRVAVSGPSTAEAVTRLLGWEVDTIPGEFTGSEAAAAMAGEGSLAGVRVLWPKARDARRPLPIALRGAGAEVDEIEAYATRADAGAVRRLLELLDAGAVDVLTFTSPSAVRSLAAVGRVPANVLVATIGPSTAAEADRCGVPVGVQAGEHTLAGLVDAIASHLGARDLQE